MANRYVRRPDGSSGSIPHDIVVTFTYDILGNAVDNWAFVADDNYEVTRVVVVPKTAGTDAGAVTLMIEKASGTTNIGSGTDILSATLDLKGTANTLQTGSLSATKSDYQLTTNDRLGVDVTGTLTAAVGMVQINLKRLQSANAAR
jgi:hypothetical protein